MRHIDGQRHVSDADSTRDVDFGAEFLQDEIRRANVSFAIFNGVVVIALVMFALLSYTSGKAGSLDPGFVAGLCGVISLPFLIGLAVAMRRLRSLAAHPVFKELCKFGDPENVMADINRAVKRSAKTF